MVSFTGKEKRKHLRIDTFLKVFLKIYSSGWDEILVRTGGTLLNLSIDACLIEIDKELFIGDNVSFSLYSKSRKIQYKIIGTVSQIRDSGTVIMISGIDPPEMVINDFRVDNIERNTAIEMERQQLKR